MTFRTAASHFSVLSLNLGWFHLYFQDNSHWKIKISGYWNSFLNLFTVSQCAAHRSGLPAVSVGQDLTSAGCVAQRGPQSSAAGAPSTPQRVVWLPSPSPESLKSNFKAQNLKIVMKLLTPVLFPWCSYWTSLAIFELWPWFYIYTERMYQDLNAL